MKSTDSEARLSGLESPVLLLIRYVTSGWLLCFHAWEVSGQALVSCHVRHDTSLIAHFSCRSATPCWMQETLGCHSHPETPFISHLSTNTRPTWGLSWWPIFSSFVSNYQPIKLPKLIPWELVAYQDNLGIFLKSFFKKQSCNYFITLL